MLHSGGSRHSQGVPHTAIVFTDGNANVEEGDAIGQAIINKLEGIHIICIAVGTSLNMIQLRGIASPPPEENIFSTRSFNAISTMEDGVVMATCNGRTKFMIIIIRESAVRLVFATPTNSTNTIS